MNNVNRMKNRSGFSLVELLVAIAIFSVIMLVVFSFMRSVTIQYGRGNTEITVQNEVQTLMAHIQDFVVAANANVGVDNSNSDIKIFMVNDYPEVTGQASRDGFRVIEFDHTNGYLYYYDWTQLSGVTDAEKNGFIGEEDRDEKFNKAKAIVTNHPIAASSTKVQSYLLTEYVSSFGVDTSHITENYIAVSVTIKKDNVHYSAAKNIFLRNKLYEIGTSGPASGGNYSANAEETQPSGGNSGGSGESGNSGGSSESGNSGGSGESGNSGEEDTYALDSLSVNSANISKFYEGDTNTNIVLNAVAVMKNSHGATYNKDLQLAPTGKSVQSEQYVMTVKYTYEGVEKQATYSVPFVQLTAIAAQLKAGVTKYQGDTLSTSDMFVENVFSDGTRVETTQFGFNSGTNKLNNLGDNIVNIGSTRKSGISTTCTVVASEKPDIVLAGEDFDIDIYGKKYVYITLASGHQYLDVYISYDGSSFNYYSGIQNNSDTANFVHIKGAKILRLKTNNGSFSVKSVTFLDDVLETVGCVSCYTVEGGAGVYELSSVGNKTSMTVGPDQYNKGSFTIEKSGSNYILDTTSITNKNVINGMPGVNIYDNPPASITLNGEQKQWLENKYSFNFV